MNFIQQAITNIHKANSINIISKASDVEYPALVYDNITGQYGKTPPTNTKEYMDLYASLAPIYRAVNVKAKAIAQLPIQILKKTGDGELEDVTDTRPEYKIFKQPNEFHTKFDFWEQAIGYLQLTGESPWLFERKNAGKISQMYPLRPDLIKVVSHNRQVVSHYLYWVSNQKEIRIDPEFMLFLKFFNPTDHLRGLSPIAAAENEVVLDLNAVQASKQTFEGGAQPSGLISTAEHIGTEEGKRVQKHIEDKYTGAKNFGKLMFLTHGFKWQQMQMNNRDMQYMEQREWNKETIAQVFGVPPILHMRFKDSSVLQNTEIQYKLFWDGIQTELTKLEETITERLLPEITDDQDVQLKFDTSKVAALQPDMVVKTKRYSEVFAMGGVKPNEIRQNILNLDPIDNPAMDLTYIPFNMQPIEDAGMDVEEETTEGKTIKFFDKITDLKRLRNVNGNGGGLIGEIKTSLAEVKQFNESVEGNVYRQKTINDLNRINNKHIKSFKKTLGVLFKAQKKEVITNLYRTKFNKFSTEGVNFDYKKWVKKFKDAGHPELAEALELVALDLASELGGTYDITDPNALKFVNKQSIEYAKMVNKTSKDKIDKILKAALQDNLSIEETAAKLTKFFDSSATMRSLRIARTEIVKATNEGRQIAAMQMKKIGFKQWITQRDGLVRDAHVIMDGETVPKDSAFSNGSFVPDEINERCYVIYRKAKG